MRAMCGEQLKKKKSMDLMLMSGLNETIDQLAMANSAHWYVDELRRDDGHVLRRALDFEGQGKTVRHKRTWKNQVERESMQVGFRREDGLC